MKQSPPAQPVRQHRSLLWYFVLRVIAPLSLPLLGLLIIGVFVYQQLVASLVFDRDSELGDLAAWDLRIELGEYSTLLRRLARDPDLAGATNEIRDSALETIAARGDSLYAGMALADVKGRIAAIAPEGLGHLASLIDTRFGFVAAPAPIESLISNVLIDPQTGESMVVLGVPLSTTTELDNKTAVALLGFVRVRGSDMTELMERLTVGGSGYAYLVDRDGRVIYHPDKEVLGADFSDRSYVQKLKLGEHGGTVWDAPTGERWIVDYTPISEAGWGVVVKEPRDVAVEPAWYYGRMLIGVGFLVVLIVFILLWTGVRRVATPIGMLAEETSRLAGGQEIRYGPESGIEEIDSLGHAFERMAKQIVDYRSSLRRYIGLLTQSQEDERRRIARELHDATVQDLISIARRIELLQDSVVDPVQREQWRSLRTMVAETAHGVRQISRDLRPPMLEDLGLVNALQALVGSQPDGAAEAEHVDLRIEGESRPLAPELELTLFRIAQEALTNVRRHAQASYTEVCLRYTDTSVQLAVRDNGVGCVLPQSFTELVQHGNLGLMGIQERVWAAGGQLLIESADLQGMSLQVVIPLWRSSTGPSPGLETFNGVNGTNASRK